MTRRDNGSSDNIRMLPGARLVPRQDDPTPQQGVISVLERLLARARSGEIQAVAFTFVRASGHCSDGWTCDAADRHYNDLAAGILYLGNRYAASVNSNDVSEPEGG